jgi:hypothetical protein
MLMVTNALRNITDFLFLHDFKPNKSQCHIIMHHKECMKHILKNKYLQHMIVCSYEVLDVLDHSNYDNRVETRTKLHPIHNAGSNAVPFVIRHMQQQHFQSTRSNYDRTETPLFLSSTFSFRYLKSHSEPALSFLLGGGGDCNKRFTTLYSLTYNGEWVNTYPRMHQAMWMFTYVVEQNVLW